MYRIYLRLYREVSKRWLCTEYIFKVVHRGMYDILMYRIYLRLHSEVSKRCLCTEYIFKVVQRGI